MSINLRDSWWLALRHMRDMWTAYIYTAIYFAFMGAVLASGISLATEIALPVLMLILVQPAVSGRYMTWKQDNEVTRHQQFLRSLPVDFGTVVTARLLAMLVAGLINTPVFFVWFWYLGTDWTSVGSFLAWILFWFGIALAGAGLSLIQEFWLSIRRWTTFNLVVIMGFIVTYPSLLWLTNARPVSGSMDLAQQSPWILGGSGLVVGCVALAICMVIAVRCFRRREFAT